MKPRWRRVGPRAEAELRDAEGVLLRAFLRVGARWFARASEAEEWRECRPADVPVVVVDLLKGVA